MIDMIEKSPLLIKGTPGTLGLYFFCSICVIYQYHLLRDFFNSRIATKNSILYLKRKISQITDHWFAHRSQNPNDKLGRASYIGLHGVNSALQNNG